MKKKFTFSPVTIVMLLLMAVLIVYWFAYMLPARREMTSLQAELALSNAQTAVYQEYLADPSPLEADIANLQEEIDRINAEDYTNDSNVSLVISDAIQRYRISLSSVSLDSVTTVDGNRALPIHLTVTGDMADILKFIGHFENNEDGSYLVQGASLETNGTTTTGNLLIYLCTPNL